MTTTRLLFGELRSGRITDYLDVTGCSWNQVANAAGTIDSVTVTADVVRRLGLRQTAQAARCFLAVDQGGRLRQAGPIWSRRWDYTTQQLTLSAAGLWSLFDHRKVIPVLAAGQYVQQVTTALTGANLGEIARALVAQAMTHLGGDLPLVLPDPRPGTANTETFEGWKLLALGDQLTQLTGRATGAPDIRFTPRYTADGLGIQWVMQTGTADQPLLVQAGDDWIFDTTAPRGPVQGIGTDEDGTAMGMRAWETGNGSEADTLIAVSEDDTLINAGWPLLEVEDSHTEVEVQATLDGYAQALAARSARPVESWTVSVHADAAVEVLPGDYARVVTAGDAWLPDGEHRMRIQQVAGDLGEVVTLTMYPLQAVL